jgi:hypothetical protein
MRSFLVNDKAKEFAALKAMHDSAVFLTEGGQPVVLLPAISFTSGAGPDSGPAPRPLPAFRLRHPPLFRARDRPARRKLEATSLDRTQLVGSVLEPRLASMKWTQMLLAHLRAVE